jgi:hypothetical protein
MERSDMQRTKLNCEKIHWATLPKLAAVAILLTGCIPSRSMAQQPGQKTFSSAEEASYALVMAAKDNDEKMMLEILGPGAKQIVSSGDETEDAESRANFVRRYQEMHRLVREPDGTTTLYAGMENWPLPLPLMNKANRWYFDAEAGKKEILYRRIGRNEISTIHVCEQLVAAQKEYWSQMKAYAQKFFSNEGQRNGLYWKSAEGQPRSPIGPLVASAVAEGYTAPHDDASATPYRGYLYRVLARQGANALGGAKSYIVDGKMTGGFAFVAYPAEYRTSGVMTFLVGEDGMVYSKDLGKDTAALAKAIKAYNPDSTWKKDEDQPKETAGPQ